MEIEELMKKYSNAFWEGLICKIVYGKGQALVVCKDEETGYDVIGFWTLPVFAKAFEDFLRGKKAEVRTFGETSSEGAF